MKLKNPCGVIVEIKKKEGAVVTYLEAGNEVTLEQDDVFIGYCWQMMDGFLHVQETLRLEGSNNFAYGKKALFRIDDIEVTVKALRGPASNNRSILPKELRQIECWNPINCPEE